MNDFILVTELVLIAIALLIAALIEAWDRYGNL